MPMQQTQEKEDAGGETMGTDLGGGFAAAGAPPSGNGPAMQLTAATGNAPMQLSSKKKNNKKGPTGNGGNAGKKGDKPADDGNGTSDGRTHADAKKEEVPAPANNQGTTNAPAPNTDNDNDNDAPAPVGIAAPVAAGPVGADGGEKKKDEKVSVRSVQAFECVSGILGEHVEFSDGVKWGIKKLKGGGFVYFQLRADPNADILRSDLDFNFSDNKNWYTTKEMRNFFKEEELLDYWKAFMDASKMCKVQPSRLLTYKEEEAQKNKKNKDTGKEKDPSNEKEKK